jgi:hypothetical protein
MFSCDFVDRHLPVIKDSIHEITRKHHEIQACGNLQVGKGGLPPLKIRSHSSLSSQFELGEFEGRKAD